MKIVDMKYAKESSAECISSMIDVYCYMIACDAEEKFKKET